MKDLLLAVFVIVMLTRAAENLFDLALIELTRWLCRRRIPLQLRQVRIEMELQRSKIPEQVRASCAATGCVHAEEHITEQCADFDAKLEARLAEVARQLEHQVGALHPTSAWQLFGLLGRPDVTVQQLRGVAALILPSSRN